MLFCRLLTSPMPHARVRDIDVSEALAMDGVVAVLTADDVPEVPSPRDPILTNNPHFIGEPILAVAAVDETTAQNAIDKIELELERLPFTVNPLQSLRPKGPDARLEGNTMVPREGIKRVKWTREDFGAVADGELPMGEPGLEWSFGDVEGGFSSAKVVLDETFVTASNSHHCVEPRSAMAYWDDGKCYLYGSSQSQSFVHPGLARLLGIEPDKLVYVAENCGGGFGSKGGPLSAPSASGIDGEENRAPGDDADKPSGRILYRASASRIPRADQDWFSRGREGARDRPLHRSGERPERRLR